MLAENEYVMVFINEPLSLYPNGIRIGVYGGRQEMLDDLNELLHCADRPQFTGNLIDIEIAKLLNEWKGEGNWSIRSEGQGYLLDPDD